MSWEPFSGAAREHDADVSGGTLERVLAANRVAAAAHPAGGLPREPARRLAIVTCMDARIDPLRVCGLRVGDAHVLRTGGARVDESVLAALRLSRDVMGTEEVLVIAHSDCAGHDSDESARADALDAARRISAAMPGFGVHALVYDVRTGRLDPIR